MIELEGAVNVRDLGGLPTVDGGAIRTGALLRSDNLQDLTPADVRRLVTDHGLRNVVDLRSDTEVSLTGPGPLTREPTVTIHHLSLFSEGGRFTDVEADTIDTDNVLPWQGRQEDGPESDRSVGHYLGYLADRPDSVVRALRVVPSGTSIVHCAAGKDRTGVVVAFALSVAGVPREEIVADYAATGERLEAILARLRSSPVYAQDLDSRPADTHMPHAQTMEKFLAVIDEHFGGPLGWLERHGWTDADTTALRATLRDGSR
ncbi:tyrosine-protein phosphatase [Actinoallomurus rhizosphaericola]|uniref:tyrosine-protein phosphatase n=1 Tax=Actinoallomurus rhizosphaericola TaxID=2952536 RepID=UPI0020923D5B|nr:tyrosine-protein phosphatase [Actinoallomurus rhizosphaericola]MCO5995140.1 tyrosine-protein phosphatase [Actinoallomurus rhizosphaericola]